MTRAQLLELGLGADAIKHRVRTGRLHPVRRGIYAVGRPQLTRLGFLRAAVFACGPEAALSHGTAAALWGVRPWTTGPVNVTVPIKDRSRPPGIAVHRRRLLPAADLTRHRGIPVTTPIRTLVDLASCIGRRQLEAAINEADKLDLVDPDRLRAALERYRGRRGMACLRQVLDRHVFTLTDSELERRFLSLAGAAGLPRPRTQQRVNGFRVDFYWPELGLVVETDGLRYHRTAAQQARDRLRDQAHTAAGLTCLRFTHAQVAHDRRRVRATLEAVVRRLSG